MVENLWLFSSPSKVKEDFVRSTGTTVSKGTCKPLPPGGAVVSPEISGKVRLRAAELLWAWQLANSAMTEGPALLLAWERRAVQGFVVWRRRCDVAETLGSGAPFVEASLRRSTQSVCTYSWLAPQALR